MTFFGTNILTTFLAFIALSQTTLASAPISDDSQSGETKAERQGKWSIASLPVTIQKRTEEDDLDKSNEEINLDFHSLLRNGFSFPFIFQSSNLSKKTKTPFSKPKLCNYKSQELRGSHKI